MKIEDFFKIYLINPYSILFDTINFTESVMPKVIQYSDRAKSISLKSYKVIKVQKFTLQKNIIGTFLITLLNNSDLLIKLLEKNFFSSTEYTEFPKIPIPIVPTAELADIHSRDHLKPFSPIPHTDGLFLNTKNTEHIKYAYINVIISQIKELHNYVQKVFIPTSSNVGYTSYNNPALQLPNATILYKKNGTKIKPYLFKYTIHNLQELFSVTVYMLSISKYKINKCIICNKYFITNKSLKTCSKECFNKSEQLKLEKNRNRARVKNSDEINYYLYRIRGVLKRNLSNKPKEKSQRESMLDDFNERYKKKIRALNRRYKTDSTGFNKELVEWLDNEYNKVKIAFPSKKYGNKNRLIK